MGWNFVCQIARFHKVIAITRENNQPLIDKYMAENPDEVYANIRFVYFDTPYWMRFWKNGGRGAMLYYWMWQKEVVEFIENKHFEFDIAHNLNFHNDWTPSYLWRLNKPVVWGPIGHHPIIPSQYLSAYRWTNRLKEQLSWNVKSYFWKYSMSLNNTVKTADHIFCMNNSVAQVLDLHANDYSIMPSVATEDFGCQKRDSHAKFTLISVGRLVPLKGFDLTILAFARFMKTLNETDKSNCELVIIGSGPERDLYVQMARENGVSAYVTFIDWIDRKDLLKWYEIASVFIFPSHEGAGMVVSEAMSFGLPVICLNNSGPGEFIDATCGFAIELQGYEKTVSNLTVAISALHSNLSLRDKMSAAARLRYETNFKWDKRGDALKLIYAKL